MSHYFSEHPDSALKLHKIKAVIRGRTFEFLSASGIFSSKKIDFGTKLLAENMIIKKNDSVLDLGCGAGILGIVAATFTSGKIVCTDINERACLIAKKNTKHFKNIIIKHGDMFASVKNMKFNVILLNPPQTAGKKVCFNMITQSKEYLKHGGSLQLVARHNKGGKTLSEKMKEVFGNVDVIAKKGGYRVYISLNRSEPQRKQLQ